MNADAIRTAIKEAIAKVGKIDPKTIRDSASFREDLGLDSLSILETIVEVQCRFKIPDVPDEAFAGIRTIDEAVRFVQDNLLAGVSA
jgi:acyl carrier protein